MKRSIPWMIAPLAACGAPTPPSPRPEPPAATAPAADDTQTAEAVEQSAAAAETPPPSRPPPPSRWVLELGSIHSAIPTGAAAATAMLWMRDEARRFRAGRSLLDALEPSTARALHACGEPDCAIAHARAAGAEELLTVRRDANGIVVERSRTKDDASPDSARAPLAKDADTSDVWVALRAAMESAIGPDALYPMGALLAGPASEVVDRNKRDVRACYGLAMRETDTTSATVRVAMRVEVDGTVGRSIVTDASLDDPLAARCTVLATQRWRFSAPTGGAEIVHAALELERKPRAK